MKRMERTIEDIGAKMDALGVWEAVAPYNWAVCPKGTVFPYFCCVMKGDGNPVNVRFMMVEGWQSFHDFVRTRIDPNFGFYSTPMEIPHFELVFVSGGTVRLFRHDPCFMPRLATDAERAFCSKILWESFGVMMRVEADSELPMKFAAEKAMFARVEGDGCEWADKALSIPDPRPHVESVTFAKVDLAKAKDLPFAAEEKIAVDFSLVVGLSTKEPRARCVYRLSAHDAATGEQFIADAVSPVPDGGLRAMWEGVAPRLLKHLLAHGRIPGEIMVCSQRLFRMLRPLCLDLPLKLSLHDKLPGVNANA